MLQPMTKGKRCHICGKGPLRGASIARRGLAKKKGGVGRKVTGHTKRSYQPNLQRVRALVDGKVIRIKACTGCISRGFVRKPVLV